MGRVAQFIKEAGRRRVLPTVAFYIAAAWVTIQVADLAIEAGVLRLSLRDFFVAAFVGFPVALVMSWFYDVTRHGLVRTPPTGSESSFDKSLHKNDYLLIASLLVMWAVATVYVHTPAPVDKSIAILPFDNLGHDPNNAMFAFGIRVDLQTQLQNLKDLKIIARESSDKIDSDMSLPDMGLKLGAAYIIKGSVERVLDRVRISVVLIDAEKELQTWAGSFDRALTATNWFDIRNEISRVIANTLQAELSPQEQQKLETVPTENLAALQAYFHGKQRMAKRTTKPLAEAVGYFQQAVELDPNFALAHVGLAESSYLHMLYSSLAEDEWFPKVEAAIKTALELDDQLGEAYAVLGVVQWMKYDDPLAADMAYQSALELNPNYATTHQWYGTFLSNQGRTEEALAQRRKAQELDPLSAIINLVTGNTLSDLGRFDEALAVYKTVIEIDPAFANAYERIGEIHRYVFGQLDEAVVWQRKGISLDPGEPWGSIFLGFIYLDLGDPDRAEYWFKRAQKLAPPGNPMLSAIMEPLYLFRGDEVKALDQARNTLTFNPTAEYSLAHLRNHDLQAGRNAEARDRYEQAYPALFGADELAIDDDNFVPAIDLALVLINTGEQERAKLLLDRSLAFIRTTPRLGMNGYGISDVLIYALQGKTGMALAALREAVDQGWRGNWWFYLEHDPGLDSIRGEPEFTNALEEIKADMAAQLERVNTLEASGELAFIPDI